MEPEFLQSVNTHQGIILKVCRMYCSNNADAEDLYQEILLQLWKAWASFKGQAKLSTWMYRVSLNTAIMGLRKKNRSPQVQELSEAQHALAEPAPGRLDILFGPELQAAIAGLGNLDKALLMLYLDERSYKEMAEITGLSETNVGVKINRIKRKLKEKINP